MGDKSPYSGKQEAAMYILLFIIGVLTRNIWKSFLHGFEFQAYDHFIDINMIKWEKY